MAMIKAAVVCIAVSGCYSDQVFTHSVPKSMPVDLIQIPRQAVVNPLDMHPNDDWRGKGKRRKKFSK